MTNPLPIRLKAARKAAGLTQQQLGMRLGMGQSTASARMNQYEKGKHAPDYQTMQRIAQELVVNDKVSVLAGFGLTPLAMATAPIATQSKTPLVVVERLNAEQLQDAKGEERTNLFYPDPRIPKDGRAELSDYHSQHPAVDRGHQSPAAQ